MLGEVDNQQPSIGWTKRLVLAGQTLKHFSPHHAVNPFKPVFNIVIFIH